MTRQASVFTVEGVIADIVTGVDVSAETTRAGTATSPPRPLRPSRQLKAKEGQDARR